MTTTVVDMKGGVSECCGALMYEDMEICCACGEHAEAVEDDDNEAMDNYIQGEKKALGWPL